jgi:molecular chaperone DnaK
MVYQSEKTINEMGDKLASADKKSIEDAITKVRTALSGMDIQSIKDATEELQKTFYAVSEKLYSNAQPHAAPGGDANPGTDPSSTPGGGQYYDADYEVVDDDKK